MNPDTCPVCLRPAHTGFALCYCCGILVRQLRMPLVPVEVMGDYQVGDRLHRRLRDYKDAPNPEVRKMHGAALAGDLGRWMAGSHDRLGRRFGRWDLVVTVPSTQRPGSPVDAVVGRVPELSCRHCPVLERGPEATGHLLAARHGFSVTAASDLSGLGRRRILLVDDTITTGARAQSAAAALRVAGARVAGVMALGRALGTASLRPQGTPAGHRPPGDVTRIGPRSRSEVGGGLALG